MCMQAQVKEWGNSQGIRLPKDVLKSAGIELNETLDVTVSNGVITLVKTFHHKTLEERAVEIAKNILNSTVIYDFEAVLSKAILAGYNLRKEDFEED
jgi:antitoxin MazE